MSIPRVLVITGPTATGKTKLGVMLAKEHDGEVVSADSMQVYRRMDIGTAKPSEEEMEGVPHHMLSVAEPWEDFSVSRYVEMAGPIVDDILSRGKLPIIVGGTGLYIDSLVSGRVFGSVESDGSLRRALEERYDRIGGESMLGELRAVDPERAVKLSPNDKKRVVRALEVYCLTGKTITEHDEETRRIPPRYQAKTIALSFKNREDLYARIDARADDMVRAGLFAEVRSLLNEIAAPDRTATGGCVATAMQAIGYKEAAEAVAGLISERDAIDKIKLASRRYAKRQLTWLRRKKDIEWIFWDEAPNFDFAAQNLI